MDKPTRLRQSIKHFRDLTDEEFEQLIRFDPDDGWYVHADITEKTDGSAWEFGIDEQGLYSRTATSPKVRVAGEYGAVAEKKFRDAGRVYDPSISAQFDRLHCLFSDHYIVSHLLHKQDDRKWNESAAISIKGEVMYLPRAKPLDRYYDVFVATAYKRSVMGSVGMFVLHSMLPGNDKHWFWGKINTFSTSELTFDHDRMICNRYPVTHIPLLFKASKSVGGMPSRNDVEEQIQQWMLNIRPKWGREREGIVLHQGWFGQGRREDYVPSVPPIKIIDPMWKQRKEERMMF